jgi:exodeoxyribonuclease VII large subunit
VRGEIDRIEQLRTRPVLAGGDWIVDSRAEELGRYIARSSELAARVVERGVQRTSELSRQLRALSPQHVLDRGYAIVQTADGSALRAPDDAPAGTGLVLRLAAGALGATSTGPTDDIPSSAARLPSSPVRRPRSAPSPES